MKFKKFFFIPLIVMITAIIVGIILGIIKSDNQFITKRTKILLSLAFAGGVSNIIDRLCRGSVILSNGLHARKTIW